MNLQEYVAHCSACGLTRQNGVVEIVRDDGRRCVDSIVVVESRHQLEQGLISRDYVWLSSSYGAANSGICTPLPSSPPSLRFFHHPTLKLKCHTEELAVGYVTSTNAADARQSENMQAWRPTSGI
jgi:hypothetical protein